MLDLICFIMSFCFFLRFERRAFYLFFITMDGLEKETVGKMVFFLSFHSQGEGVVVSDPERSANEIYIPKLSSSFNRITRLHNPGFCDLLTFFPNHSPSTDY